MTTNKEDYLKAIYHSGGLNERATTKAIAEQLGIASASVTEMLARLAREGLILYEPYKGSQLTEKGLRACIGIVRSHELWEVFLVRYLDYSWSEAHEDAEFLEHATTERLAERLDHFLQHPEVCPHGAVIPRLESIPEERKLSPLAFQPVGKTAVIRQVEEEKELLDYLEGLGMKIGSHATVLSFGAYDGPLEILLDGHPVQISRKAAEKIRVEPEA
ncbi:MAG: metal-dependent transcriptional regulator [Ruminococcaceae bacterium]|jgi:Mn-dependent transcriptional regulator|nr:metal-dependent transcriptional regulator [Oscillospiraceae bacterium]